MVSRDFGEYENGVLVEDQGWSLQVVTKPFMETTVVAGSIHMQPRWPISRTCTLKPPLLTTLRILSLLAGWRMLWLVSLPLVSCQ